jgi:hypothetical protein
MHQATIGKVEVCFVFGSALKENCDGLIVPIIQKGTQLDLDYAAFNEIKKGSHR